jgi:hypothetical protein
VEPEPTRAALEVVVVRIAESLPGSLRVVGPPGVEVKGRRRPRDPSPAAPCSAEHRRPPTRLCGVFRWFSHAGERVEVGGVREVAGRQCVPEQRPSRLNDSGLEEVEQFGVAFLFGEQ